LEFVAPSMILKVPVIYLLYINKYSTLEHFCVPILKALGNTEKSNMKIGSKFDPRLEDIFLCRTLEN